MSDLALLERTFRDFSSFLGKGRRLCGGLPLKGPDNIPSFAKLPFLRNPRKVEKDQLTLPFKES